MLKAFSRLLLDQPNLKQNARIVTALTRLVSTSSLEGQQAQELSKQQHRAEREIPQSQHKRRHTGQQDSGQAASAGSRWSRDGFTSSTGQTVHQQRHTTGESPQQGTRQNTGYSGYFESTWPIVVSNLPTTAILPDILQILPLTATEWDQVRIKYTKMNKLDEIWIAMDNSERQRKALSKDGHRIGLRRVNISKATPRKMSWAFPDPRPSSKQASVLISDLSLEVTVDDIMRLFSNYEMHSSPVNLHLEDLSGKFVARNARETKSHSTQCALVRFASFSEACRAVRSCNFYLIKDTVISMRLLP